MLVSRLALGTALAVSLGLGSVGSAWAIDKEISVGAPAATKKVPFTVYFPLTHQAALEQFLKNVVDPKSPIYHHWLTPGQFKDAYGPDPKAVAQVKAALAAAGMTVKAEHTQSLEAEASAAAAQSTFGIHLNTLRSASTGLERNVALEGHATLPAAFTAAGAHIVGFEPKINMHVQSHRVAFNPAAVPAARLDIAPLTQAYFADDMKAAYSFPSFQTFSKGTGLADYQQIVGLGTNIGILMSSIAQNSDLALQLNSTITLNGGGTLTQAYTANSNLPAPVFTIREVSGGSGPFGNSAADEASLDTQMSLGTAQGATEQLYDIPDLSDASVLAGYTAIVEDNTVDVVSSSFGGCEFPEVAPNPFNGFISEGWVLNLEHQIYEQGNAQGITFVASSGDEGSLPCPTDLSATGYYASGGTSPAAPGVEEPAADPDVTGVGGTNLATTSTADAVDTYVEENSYGDPLVSPFDIFGLGSGGMTGGYWGSGGGVSQFFAKPDYQNLVDTRNATQRTVPDISMQMGGCPGGILTDAESNFCNTQERSFTLVIIGGELSGLIGTSSSSPQFAGVVAHMIQLAGGGSGANPPAAGQPNAPAGRLGNINPMLYSLAATQIAAGGPQAPANLQYFNRRIQGFSGYWGNDTILAYSYVLGVGTPNVTNLLGLQGAVPAGNPGTITNP
jgi:subtilase family serine protease